MTVAYPLKGNPEPRHIVEAANDLNTRVEDLEDAPPGGGASDLPDLGDVDNAAAPDDGHFLVGDGSAWSNRPLEEADIPATIATNTEVTSAISAHAGEADPHTGYQKESEKGAASGYASLDGSTKVPIAQVPTGTTGTTVALGNHNHDAAYEAAGAVAAHSADTTSVHGIADTSALETTTGAQSKVDAHVNDATAAHAASAISFAPAGSISSTTVQAAIEEVASEAGGGSGNTLYAPGSITVSTGNFQLHANFLSLGAGENLTIEGTGAFVIV